MKEQNPLVSIIVITYNSAKYVLETLESAKAQTYQNIELIVTDDCSTDNTVEICSAWIDKNKDRFIRTELITVPKNTGIPANCNRGVKAVRGEWMKIIAGDDLLLDNCIELNVQFVKNDSSIMIVHSNSKHYRNTFEANNYIQDHFPGVNYFRSKEISAFEQYRILLRNCDVNAPTEFFSTKVIFEVGMFDESIRMVEDWPMFLKLTKLNYKVNYLNKITVLYRIHDESTFQNRKHNTNLDSQKLVYNKYILPYISNLEIFEYYLFNIVEKIIFFFPNNKFNRILTNQSLRLKQKLKSLLINSELRKL